MATKTSADVRGVRSVHEEVKPHKIMPYRPENKNLTRDEFVAWRAKQKKADAAADAARAKALAEVEETEGPEAVASKESDEKIKKLRADFAKIEKKLVKTPDDPKLMKERNKIAEALDKAEDGE